MRVFLWFLTCWWALSILGVIAQVGRPRKPITAGGATFAAAVLGGFIAWAWAVLGRV